MPTSITALETRLRRLAGKHGYVLHKRRERSPYPMTALYFLSDASTNCLATEYGVDLDAVEEFLLSRV